MSADIQKQDRSAGTVCAAALLAALGTAPVYAYDVVDLGAHVEPVDISELGVVVGSSNTEQYPATAFRWSPDSGFEIIEGGTATNAVNNRGQIAGSTVDGAFIVDGSYRDWSDYGAFGSNQAGTVAGYSVGNNPYQPRSLPYNPAIFTGNKWQVFDIARLYPRGTRQGVYADRFILNAINEAGYAVGYKYRYGLSGSSAILIDTNEPIHDAGDVTYLPTPNGGRATAINNGNVVAGTSGSNSGAGEYAHAFVYDYDRDLLTDLGTLPSNGTGSEPGLTSYAYDINDANQVVGSSWLVTANTSLVDPAKYHAFLWVDGHMSDLNELAALPAGMILTRATAINENGDIVGVALVDGVEHGFLLTNDAAPAPPPTENLPPMAIASADPLTGKAPLMVYFDGSGSTDPDGDITSYSWDFNDGSPAADTRIVQHEFSGPGSYLVTLTVTDDLGARSATSLSIKVRKGKRN